MFLLQLRNRHFLIFDLLALACIPALALAVRLDLAMAPSHLPALLWFTVLGLIVKPPIFYLLGLYNRYWRYASMDEVNNILLAVAASSALVSALFILGVVTRLIPATGFPRSVPILDFGLTLLLVGGSRLSVRALEHRRTRQGRRASARRVLIVGAGDSGSLLARELRASPGAGLEPVAFLDDDPAKRGMRIHDLPVAGGLDRLPRLADEYKAREVLIAMPSAPGRVIREIVRACETAGLPSRTLPSLAELVSGRVSASHLRPVNIEDLLRREPVDTDLLAVRGMLAGRRVLVTGAGGSIGAELCRQIARCAPAALIALGHGENSLFDLAAELQHRASEPRTNLKLIVADIRDRMRLEAVFQRCQPEVIFHAAAHKHVPLMEDNVEDAVSNNVRGTLNLVTLAEAHGVERFVLISSDKAVNPVSVMGVTKRVAERLVIASAQRCGRAYVAVRFGNVLGSRGSVVPLFQQQIARGGPLTVTHPEMRRYFMTIAESVQLVLQAAVLGEPGRVFVLDMGQPVRLRDLAADLVRLSGLQLGRDVSLVFTGVRPGEKLNEELFGGEEPAARTRHAKIFVANNGHHSASALALEEQVDRLLEAAEAGRLADVRHWLLQIVPEYSPAENSSLADAGLLAEAAAPLPLALPEHLRPEPGD
jgi:FlaA1/EpsC-like NDP-sugar epimerase